MRKIFTNAQGISLDADNTRFDTLVVEGETILAVGGKELLSRFPAPPDQIIDLRGKAILPGFIDAHQHLQWTGQVLGSADVSRCTHLADVFAVLHQQRGKISAGDWVLAYQLFDQNLQEKRMPTAAELDAVCDNVPVAVVHASFHFVSLNSLGLQTLALQPDMDGVDAVQGNMTGLVRDPASFNLVLPQIDALMPDTRIVQGYHAAARAALRRGITCLHCLDGKDGQEAVSLLLYRHKDELPLHIVQWNQNRDVQSSLALGLPRIGGCICADGAIDCYTAALFEPYRDQPDNYGSLTYTQQEMDAFVIEAHRQGLQLAVHCETDRAIEQVLHAMEKALRLYPRGDHRHRIEHLEVPTCGQIERMAAAGIIASMQPAFFPYLMQDQQVFANMLGPSRHKLLHPYRTILDAGVMICGGSDSPVTPYDPLSGIQAAVCHPYAPERVSLTEALRMFTTAAAFSAFEEHERGSLQAGMKAEFIVLDQSPYDVASEDITKLHIEQIFANGKLYTQEELSTQKMEKK